MQVNQAAIFKHPFPAPEAERVRDAILELSPGLEAEVRVSPHWSPRWTSIRFSAHHGNWPAHRRCVEIALQVAGVESLFESLR